MNLRAIVMDLPPDERLPAALDLLDTLAGNGEMLAAWMQAYRLTRQEASVWHVLNGAAGRVVTRDALMLRAFGFDSGRARTLDVVVLRIRRKVPVRIETVAGVGFRATVYLPPPPPVDTDTTARPREGTPWTDDDDAELIRMVRSGSRWWAIAEELDRTERGCMDRWHKLLDRRAA